MDGLKPANQHSLVSWPSPQDYNEAVQNPAQSFADLTLSLGEAETDSLGLPRPNTGMFASVYHMRCGESDWALRCFLHYVPDQVERYSLISDALSRHKLPSTVHFDMQERGILVRGQWFPVLKMQWCEGVNLDLWLKSKIYDREALESFLDKWKQVLLSFRSAGIAHGDLQHGNILVNDGVIKVVDYDGMFVPGLEAKPSNELGHRAYQHPGRTDSLFGPELDNFSAWVIYLSVEILSHDPAIWQQLRAGDDCLLFRRKDFEQPQQSRAFYLLEHHSSPEIRDASKLLRFLLTLPPEQIPFLDSRPVIPVELLDLEPQEELEPWFSDDELKSALAEDDDCDGAESGSFYQQKKRPRSRTKGGYTGWRPSGEPEPEIVEAPVVLSPLAQLARTVQGKAIPASSLAAQNAPPPASTSGLSSPLLFSSVPISSGQPAANRNRILLWICIPFAIIASIVILLTFAAIAPLSLLHSPSTRSPQVSAPISLASDTAPPVQDRSGVIAPGNDNLSKIPLIASGDNAYRTGEFDLAASDYKKAAEVYLNGDEERRKTLDFAGIMIREGKAHEQLQEYDDAFTCYAEAARIYKDLGQYPATNSVMKDLLVELERVKPLAEAESNRE